MKKIGKALGSVVVKYKILVVIISLILLIPSIFGYVGTHVNYDILVYLPEDIETMKGQKILEEDFDMGSFAICSVDKMQPKDILKLEDTFKNIKGVNKVISANDLIGTTIPLEMLPDEFIEGFKKDESQLMLVTFQDSTIAIDAIREMRELTNSNVKIGGMSASTLDTSVVADSEIVIYVIVAVALVLLILTVSLDSYLVPILLLGNIGIAILYNMGTNIFLGEISYITKAIAAVLQLGVTTDFSIFLYHKYERLKGEMETKELAMSEAIGDTLVSVAGSSLTTVAGFLALCTMQLTLGTDIGIVMAKGVILGVISTVTVFPAFLLVFDKWVEKTHHKSWLPGFKGVKTFVLKYHKVILVLAIALAYPAFYGNQNVKQYYNLTKDLPHDLESCIANTELKDKFNLVSPEIILINKDIKDNTLNMMIDEIEDIKGIDMVLSPSQLSELSIPEEMMSDELKSVFESDQYQMIYINSLYEVATDELNDQITQVNQIVKSYDEKALLAGEGPCMKDLVSIADQDFQSVNITSIVVIFIIMMIVLKSISLPVLLVAGIELAVFINMSFAYYMGDVVPFVASIVIGTIQLGATIDYAILLTTKYLEGRKSGQDKMSAMGIAIDQSVGSIVVSALSLFAATFGVGMISELKMIASLCTLLSRGTLVSMVIVICVIPALLLIFDKLVLKTSIGFKEVQ
jgi:predicted RND superfamily exporter protein